MELANAFSQGCNGFILGGAATYNLIAYLLDMTAEAGESGLYHEDELVEAYVWPKWLSCDQFIRKLWGLFSPSLYGIEMAEFYDICDHYRPDFVVIDMLGELLANMGQDGSLDEICDTVLEMAWKTIHKYDANVAVIMAPLARSADISTSYDEYEDNVIYIKHRMAEIVVQHESVYFWDLPSIVIGDTDIPLPVHHFSTDLKVPGPDYASNGFQLYLSDISDMLKSVSWVTCMAINNENMLELENQNVDH